MGLSPVFVELKAGIGDLKAKMAEAEGEIRGMSDKGSSHFAALAQGAKVAFAGVAIATVAAGAIALKSADEFGKIGGQVLQLQRYTGGSAESMSRLRTAFELSGIDIDKAGKAMGIFSKNIASGKIDGLKTDFSNGAAGAAGLEKATTKLNDAQKQLTDLQDRLHGKATLSVSDMQHLRDANDKVAKAQDGVNASSSGSASAADKYGIAIRDSAGKMLPMHDILLNVADRFKAMPNGVDKTALAMQLFGKSGADMTKFLNRGRDGIAALEKESDKYGLTLSGSNLEAVKKSTAAHRELGTAWEGIQVQIGAHVLPVITAVTSFMAEQIPKATGLVQSAFDRLHPAFTWIQEAAGYVVQGVQVLVEGFQTAGNGPQLSGFAGAIQRVGEVARKLVDGIVSAWPTIQSTAVTVFGAVTGAVSTVASFIADHWPEMQATAATVMGAIQTAVGAVSDFIRSNWPAIQSTAETVFGAVQTAVGNVVGFFQNTFMPGLRSVIEWVKTNWKKISETFSDAFQLIKGIVMINWAIIAGIIYAGIKAVQFVWDHFGKQIVDVLKSAFDFVAGIIHGAMEIVKGIINTVMALIHGDWGKAWDGIKQILGGAWDVIKSYVLVALDTIKNVIQVAWDTIKGVFSTAWDAIAGVITGAWDGIKNKGIEWIGDLVSMFSGVGSTIAGALGDLVAIIGAPFKAAWNFIADTWNSTIGKLHISVPSWVPGIGGDGFDMPSLPTLHTGGVYRAPTPGGEGLAMLLDGEIVVNPRTAKQSQRASQATGGPTVIVHVAGHVTTDRALVDMIRSQIARDFPAGNAFGGHA